MATEKRLICLDSVIEQLENEWGYEGMREDLYNLPTVDAVELVHGRWRLETDEEEPNPLCKVVVCSVCGKMGGRNYKYCPNCGAKMDGGNEDEKDY